jgi:hypothetical protein
MENRSDTGLGRAVLIVGLANAVALAIGFLLSTATTRELTRAVQEKTFAYPPAGNFPASTTVNQSSVINLSNGRFVVVDHGIIGLYQVDAKNQIRTLRSTTVAQGPG